MSILLDALSRLNTAEEVSQALRDYHAYLESIRSALPHSAYEFAIASWHYDHNDHRCPHDSWVGSLQIREPSSGVRHEKREIEVAIRLLGAYHDGHLELLYPGVRSYSLSNKIVSPQTAHGDWLVDEIRLSENNLVLHEILFRSGGRWTVESRDILSRWQPSVLTPSP